jgi:hypothetical protein
MTPMHKAILVFVAALLLLTPGQARSASCWCTCVTDGGLTRSLQYDDKGYGCKALQGKTCNLVDPETQGNRSGSLTCQG